MRPDRRLAGAVGRRCDTEPAWALLFSDGLPSPQTEPNTGLQATLNKPRKMPLSIDRLGKVGEAGSARRDRRGGIGEAGSARRDRRGGSGEAGSRRREGRGG